MTSLRHYDPLSIEPISDMLRAFRGTADPGMVFKVDVTESEGSYTVTAEVPGVKREDIDINVARGTVMISAKVERTTEQRDGERVIRHERYSGAMRRAFTLDADIDESKVDATYTDGVLRLELPKKEATPQKRIQIRSAEVATQ
ncbi:heat shock protein Hsp20 [Ralstonia sp. 25mfcol4.1]|uniref:Hsp20/alpha crystallin family protein n=1 Tax=Ralstonia sp. 25mfcol4.1 TaxID=1761899 RepID=UPI000888BD03|nr:Hsp20/alpha crystallin family protein [Ralstonia sp. 25mfcol4.1]SDP72030.1 heat shock protein Hsp20 [Ralstonia sp. 25mfcol4.1]